MKQTQFPKEPRKDEERDTQKAMVKDASKTNEARRDKVHGDGDTVDLDSKPR
ncbi:hypothetical protein [Pseudolabrys sp. Root1462]|jgi:hypothetical protein|uniref:hypothetical protein n=1 Tax=Pseudolabrys sp. Root1462 TaxID=1736466 RepID=UPI0013DE28B9|nr:hypothetical protein [Pseudolabrys sp. Root1462]